MINISNETEQNATHQIISHSVRFSLLLTFEIPSIICYIIVLSHILNEKSIRSSAHNYVIFFILLFSFVVVCLVIPWEMDYYRRNEMPIESSIFCMICWFIDFCSFYTCQILVAWACFERHLLIFHHHLFDDKWKKIFFHYIPPLILIIYMWIFHLYVIFIFPCENYIDSTSKQCLYPCYLSDSVFGIWESIFHGILITICIIIFSSSFLIRVYRSKNRLQQSVNWWKYRRIIFQLISLSSLYVSINFPLGIIYIIHRINSANWPLEVLECLGFLSYLIPLVLPFICLSSLSEIWIKLRRSLNRRENRRVQPMPLHTTSNDDFISVTPV